MGVEQGYRNSNGGWPPFRISSIEWLPGSDFPILFLRGLDKTIPFLEVIDDFPGSFGFVAKCPASTVLSRSGKHVSKDRWFVVRTIQVGIVQILSEHDKDWAIENGYVP